MSATTHRPRRPRAFAQADRSALAAYLTRGESPKAFAIDRGLCASWVHSLRKSIGFRALYLSPDEAAAIMARRANSEAAT